MDVRKTASANCGNIAGEPASSETGNGQLKVFIPVEHLQVLAPGIRSDRHCVSTNLFQTSKYWSSILT